MIEQWHGCYDDGWKGLITPESFAHPAKFSRGLIERIYRHCLDRGYLRKGDLVADCFGGIGTGGIMAAYAGLRWIGCELEPRFCEFAKANFALHASKLRQLGLPEPQMIQGDSRQFDRLVGQACGIVSSPPYAEAELTSGGEKIRREKRTLTKLDGYGTSPGQIGALPAGNVAGVISSPPFQATSGGAVGSLGKETPLGKRHWQGVGARRESGNIETLPPGDLAAVVSSPPYGDQNDHKRPDDSTRCRNNRATISDPYGQSPGQIGKLKGGELQAVVSSPPYESSLAGSKNCVAPHDSKGTLKGQYADRPTLSWYKDVSKRKRLPNGTWPKQRADEDNRNIGLQTAETYWRAVRDVYAACWRAIKPGGVMVLVVKSYVKQRKVVDLPSDTLTLLVSLGFEPLERIQAMLKTTTVHNDLFEGTVTKVKSRASFFRRLAEKKGSPPIDFEEVLICRKPNDSEPCAPTAGSP